MRDPALITLAGQSAWLHDEGHEAGFFHTYDALQVAGGRDSPRKLHVLLPRGYETGEERYPVVYMNDGHTAFFGGGLVGKSWEVAARLGELYAEERLPPVIVVAVHPVNRDREYTHAQAFWGHDHGGLVGYGRYLAEALKPFVDSVYRTRPEPASNLLVGAAHGGLAAFYTACVHREAFGRCAAFSPSFWCGHNGALEHSALLGLVGEGLSDEVRRPRLWIDWGRPQQGGMQELVMEAWAADRGREMSRLLQRRFGYTVDLDLHVREDGTGHDEEAWSKRFRAALPVLLGR